MLSPFFLEEAGVAGYFLSNPHLLEVYCYPTQRREKSSHPRLQSVYLNSAKFTEFMQKDFCRKWRCHRSVSHVQSFSALARPQGKASDHKGRDVQISVRAKQSSNAVGKPITLLRFQELFEYVFS